MPTVFKGPLRVGLLLLVSICHLRRKNMNPLVRMLALGAVLFAAYPNFAISGTEDDLNRLEEKRYAAAIAGDWPALDALLADEFYYNQASGNSVTKTAYLGYLKTGEIKVKKAVRQDTKIKLYGDIAVITGIVFPKGIKTIAPIGIKTKG